MKLSLAVLILSNCVFASNLPIAFEKNQGQAPPEVAFLARDGVSHIFLTHDGTAIAAGGVTIRLVGASPAAPAGLHPLEAQSNYLIGSNPSGWHTAVPNYREVRYARAYPKIDVVWHARGGEIEHDFELAPGADPRLIRFAIDGVSPGITAEHDLSAGAIRLHRPHAYQDGREISCRYELRGRVVRFVLGPYHRNRPLTIDPVLSFSTLLGGSSGEDSGRFVGLDSAGNIYVAGTTGSADFPVTAGAFQTAYNNGTCQSAGSSAPCHDLFVSKFSNDGSTLLYSTFLGSSGDNALTAAAVDGSGNVYLTGFAGGSNFPQLTQFPGYTALPSDPFLVKLNPAGSALIYSTTVPVRASNSINAMAVDAAGAVYLTGAASGNLPLVNALQNSVSQPPLFKTNDSAAHWQSLGTSLPSDLAVSMAVDPSNAATIYVGMDQGLYKSTDGGNTWIAQLQGTPTQYVAPQSIAIDPSNSQIIYAALQSGISKSTNGGATWTSAGAGATQFIRMIAINPAQTSILYAAGDDGVLYKSTDAAATWKPTSLGGGTSQQFFVSSVVIDPSNPSTLYAGTASGVMKSLDAGATWTAMTTGFTTSLEINALVIDPVNPQVLYAVGNGYNVAPYRTSDGGAHWSQGQWAPPGGLTPYVLSLLVDPSVHTTVWAATDEALLVSRDSGATWTSPPTDLPYYNVQRLASGPDGSVYALANNFGADAFALKLDPTATKIVYSTYLGGSGPDGGQSIAVDSTGRALIGGFTSSFDFPTANALQPHPGGMRDAFVSVLDPAGSQLAWSTYLGGANDDWGSGIAVDPAGNVHVGGWTSSANFPLRQASQSQLLGTSAFASKFKSDGSSLIFSTLLGGSGGDAGYSVAADAAGNTYLAGQTGSHDFPTLNPVQSTLAGPQNAFVAAWNGQTGALEYSTYLGGSGSDLAWSVAADASGNAYVAGYTRSPDFPRKYAYQYTFGGQDAFLAKIAAGTAGPAITLAGTADAASYRTPVAPGEIVSIFGKDMAVTPASSGSPPLPTKLSDVQVTVNGVAAPLFYVSPYQINAQIPYETAPGTAQIQVSSGAGTAVQSVPVTPAAPAIFTLNASGSGAGAIEHGLTGQLVTGADPATAGETVAVYCTGLGALNPPVATGDAGGTPLPQTVLPVQASVAGVAAAVAYAGLAPGFAGLYQVNVQIPAGTAAGTQTLQISIDGAGSNPVTLSIH